MLITIAEHGEIRHADRDIGERVTQRAFSTVLDSETLGHELCRGRHELHEPDRAPGGNHADTEAALGLDQGKNEGRIKAVLAAYFKEMTSQFIRLGAGEHVETIAENVGNLLNLHQGVRARHVGAGKEEAEIIGGISLDRLHHHTHDCHTESRCQDQAHRPN